MDARKARLCDIVRETGAKTIHYLYDFGDSWDHVIKLEKWFENTTTEGLPFLLEAAGRCPPEDVGGAPGYAEYLAAISDPGHPEHEHMRLWGPERFDPNVVDRKARLPSGSRRLYTGCRPANRQALAALDPRRWYRPLSRASQIRSQQQRQRGWKLYSFHAPEVECIGKGKAAAPYEFGVKASIVTNNRRAPGGVFVLHARALPDNPYDGHTLRDVIDRTETLTGCAIERAYVDKGYRGHDAQNPRRIFISGQKRGVFGVIKRELRRRSAIEPIIGHLKTDGHLGRCYLKGRAGDAANVILSAVGHNFRRILAWLRAFWRLILTTLIAATSNPSPLKSRS